MKLSKLTIFNIVLSAIIVAILSTYYFFSDDLSLASLNKSNEKTEHSAFPGVDLLTEVIEETTYNIAIHYPHFQNKSLNTEIVEYISNTKKEFLNEVESNKVNLTNDPASLYISYDIHPFANEIYSIILNTEVYMAGATGQQSSKVFLVDTQNKRLIEPTEILIDDAKTRNTIYRLLSSGFNSSDTYKPYLFPELLKQWVYNENNKYANMYLTSDSIVFKFDKSEVTEGEAGSPEISIPFQSISEVLTDDLKTMINLDVASKEEPTVSESPKPPEENHSEKEPEADTSSNKKKVALTFDDGPHPTNTVAILDLLDKYNAKATFFMLGNRVKFYPKVAKEVLDRGHEIGNHTWTHKDITSLSQTTINQEINSTTEAIKNATGQSPTRFRPPYGAINKTIRESIDLPITLWTIDTLDWKSRDANKVLSVVKNNVSDGSIILMHDIHKTTVEAIALVLEYLEKEGYELVTVSELESY